MKQRGYNFNPGPAVLPEIVLERAKEDLLNYRSSGMGVAELSHRGSHFEEIIQGATQLLRDLLAIPEEYCILFCTGGATQQFSMVPMNLLAVASAGNYLISGVWSELAAAEAKKFGHVHIAGTSKDNQFRNLPEIAELSADAAYLHFTSNNTVVGSQFLSEPEAETAPLICDASSDFLSRWIDIHRYDLIYAGAQKTLGPAGVTLVVMKKELLKRIPDGLPLLMDYRTYEKSNSLHNTPPTFPIYLVREVLQWLKDSGGVTIIQEQNEAKAELFYSRIDASEFYDGLVNQDCRSKMNATFRLANAELDKTFLKNSEAAGIFGLKGHRLMGGFRASMYNAMPLAGVQALVSFMNDFEKRNG